MNKPFYADEFCRDAKYLMEKWRPQRLNRNFNDFLRTLEDLIWEYHTSGESTKC